MNWDWLFNESFDKYVGKLKDNGGRDCEEEFIEGKLDITGRVGGRRAERFPSFSIAVSLW